MARVLDGSNNKNDETINSSEVVLFIPGKY